MNLRPFIVEFTGTPEAGKTTTINKLIPLIEKNYKLNACYIQESAEIVPKVMPKGSFDANFWMRAITVAELLKQYYNSNNDLIIVDRGIVDSQFFGHKFFMEGKCSLEEFESYNSLINNPKLLPDFVIYLKTSPEEAVKRRGGEGRVVTADWIKNYNSLFDDYLSSVTSPVFAIDTTTLSEDEVVTIILNNLISYYNRFKEEK